MKFDRITVDPARMNGQPCIRDIRLTVRRVVGLAAMYPDREELRREFPELEDEDIRQALLYSAANIDDLLDEAQRDNTVRKTRGKLEAAARSARREIAEGRAEKMDFDRL